MPRVVIQIVTYNSAAHIRACLASVKNQTFKDTSVIVIDNASKDQTVHIVQSLGFKVKKKSVNVGYAGGHNIALRLATSEYVLTLNPDAVLYPTFLSVLMSAMLRAPQNTGSASGLLLRASTFHEKNARIDSAGLFMRRNRRAGLRFEDMPFDKQNMPQQSIFGPDGAVALYKRQMLEDIAVHGEVFDEGFFAYKEDIDVCWRAAIAGWKSLFVPGARALHTRTFKPGQRAGIPTIVKRLSVRNRYLLLVKNDTFTDIFLDFPYIFVYELMILGFVIFKERSSFQAYWQSIILWPTMWDKRRLIQKRRRVPGHEFRKILFQQ